jgi:hypothetical protein
VKGFDREMEFTGRKEKVYGGVTIGGGMREAMSWRRSLPKAVGVIRVKENLIEDEILLVKRGC